MCKWAYSKEISTKKKFESCDTIISYFCISNLCQSAKVTVVKGFGEQGADRLQVYTSDYRYILQMFVLIDSNYDPVVQQLARLTL